MDAWKEAERFLTEEQQFHLGFLPTEQSHPLTRNLDRVFAASIPDGIRLLQRVDENVLATARRVFAEPSWHRLTDAAERAVSRGRRVILSGCGATGRLSILLEAMWRGGFCTRPAPTGTQGPDAVAGIITGGDFALVRSVEFFEDYAEFGRRQVRDLGVGAGDVLVAITEGGETSSVLGSLDEGVRRGAQGFLVFNNPAELLRTRLERCRRAIDDPRVVVLDLSCGPMAIAGSTRMQAATCSQLVVGAALEVVLHRTTGTAEPEPDFARAFADLRSQLGTDKAVDALARHVEQEAGLYAAGGRVTYFAGRFLLDVFTDTTERSPTFMLPPFRRIDDIASPAPWAFVKDPGRSTPAAWRACLGRAPRCLEWTAEDYRQMGAEERIAANPPRLDQAELMRYAIGREDMPCRYSDVPNAAVRVGDEPELVRAFDRAAAAWRTRAVFPLPFRVAPTPLRLIERLGVKLAMNTVSTATMVRMGRVAGNGMSWVDVTNKKLFDRGARLVEELCGTSYADACFALARAIEHIRSLPAGNERPSPVQVALQSLGRQDG